MATIITSKVPWRNPPTRPVQINRTHWSYTGLLYLVSGPRLLHPHTAVFMPLSAGMRVVGVRSGLGAIGNSSTVTQFILPTTRLISQPTTMLLWDRITTQQRNAWTLFSSSLSSYMGIAHRSDRTTRAVQTTDYSTTTALTNGNEYHFAGVFNGLSSRTLYVDGAAQTENTATVADATLDRFYINQDTAGSDPMAEGRVYDGVLSASQIYALSNDPSERWGIYTPLISRVYFDMSSGGGGSSRRISTSLIY